MTTLEKISSKVCSVCPICNYARKHPEAKFSQMIKSHTEGCIAWKAYEEEHKGEGQSAESNKTK